MLTALKETTFLSMTKMINIGEDNKRLSITGDCQYVNLNSLINNADYQSGWWLGGNDVI